MCSSAHLCLTWELPAGPLPRGRKDLLGKLDLSLFLLTSIFLSFALFFQEALKSFKGLSWREGSASLCPPSGLRLSFPFSKMGSPH